MPDPDPLSLRAARQSAGLSLRQAETFLRSRGVDVSERTIGNYERGETEPSDTMRRSMLAAYGQAMSPGNTAGRTSTADLQARLLQEARDRGDAAPGDAPAASGIAASGIEASGIEATGGAFPHSHVLPLLNLVVFGQPVGRVSILVEHQALHDVGLDIPLAAQS